MVTFVICIAIAAFCIGALLRTRRPARLMPESLTTVAYDETGVRIADGRGETRHIAWDDIQRIVIRTTDQGPFLPDVFWLLHLPAAPPAVFYGGATGEQELLAEFQRRLPSFRSDAVIAAMSSTSNREFVAWERE